MNYPCAKQVFQQPTEFQKNFAKNNFDFCFLFFKSDSSAFSLETASGPGTGTDVYATRDDRSSQKKGLERGE